MFSNSFINHIRVGMFFRRTTYVSGILFIIILLLIICPAYLVPEYTEAAICGAAVGGDGGDSGSSGGSSTLCGGSNSSKAANPATLTYNTTSSAASVSLTVSDNAGSFATSGSNELASFSLITNNATGYTLNLKTSDNTTSLSDGTNNIATIDNTKTASNFSNNTWGLLPSKYNGTANTANYYPASSTGFKMDETSAANTTANTYTVGLGLKANYATAAGTYTTANTDNGNTGASLVLEYVANAVTYSINYYTNTNDTVTGMPSINPQTGTVSQGTTSTSVNLASAPSRTGYNFLGWCMGTSSSSNITTTDGVDSCGNSATNQFTAGQSFGIDATKSPDTYYMYAMWQIQSYTQTVRYRYENADGSFGSYTTVTETKNYGTTYSWSTANISNFDSTIYQSNSISSYTVTGEQSTDINIYRNTFTCTKRFRLQNADGSFPSTYDTSEGTITGVKYGASCSYTKTVTDYKGSSYAANGASGTASASNVTSDRNIDIDFYRNTYTLTVTAGTNTSGASGGGTKLWGQTVAVGVTKATNTTCISYATPTWSQSGTAGTFSSTSGASVNFTMGKGDATVTAASDATNVPQTITLTKGTGVNGITIGGTKYTDASVPLTCGSYAITAPTANFNSGYEFSSWAVSGSLALGSSTTTASNTITVSGAGTLTLNGKLSCQTTVSGTMQAFNPSSLCSNVIFGTLTDSRDAQSYNVAKLADGKWWMLDNLRLNILNSTTLNNLTTSNTNANSSSLISLKSGNRSAGAQYATAGVSYWSSSWSASAPLVNAIYADNIVTNYGAGTGKVGVYYNYCAATAGSYCYGDGKDYGTSSGNAMYDLCPYRWRMPTGGSNGEYKALYVAYGSNVSSFHTAFSSSLSGYIGDSNLYSQGSNGYFWSSTKRDSNDSVYMHALSISSSSVSSTYDSGRGGAGYSIRCLFGM